ncbi:oxygenase MpaB family protein [uncultured Hymenobacter sp.]|uniref:oxygenase MpaB family protein n=1 Tax=uncultured Hymenobacter sp. TaxID=170016 RepID=UPI0035CBAA95
MTYFVSENSVVRAIWAKADTVLFIFAGAAAEFALNKAVDWLYFTGRLPADPLARLFSTVEYARQIVYSDQAGAERAIDTIAAIHGAVEAQRGQAIPDWAYRDVLFLLIDYSIRAFEVLERPLTPAEKNEIVDVFVRVGQRMGLTGLPATYAAWQPVRQQHLAADLAYSRFTADLYRQYRRHLGPLRYWLLRQAQRLVVPATAREQLALGPESWLRPVLPLYRRTQRLALGRWLKSTLLPPAYKQQILALDGEPANLTPGPSPKERGA